MYSKNLFWNREKELNELFKIVENFPSKIYFIYGPINSGKTTLIYEFINRFDKEKICCVLHFLLGDFS